MADPAFQDEVFATVREAITNPEVPPSLRLKAALKCLDKMTPSLKSVDHQGLHPVAITFVSCLDGAVAARQEAIEQRAAQLAARTPALPPLPEVAPLTEGLPAAKEDYA